MVRPLIALAASLLVTGAGASDSKPRPTPSVSQNVPPGMQGPGCSWDGTSFMGTCLDWQIHEAHEMEGGYHHYPEIDFCTKEYGWVCSAEDVYRLEESVSGTVPYGTTEMTTLPQPESIPRDYHLLTVSYGGAVSLIKGLSEKECKFSRARLLGLPATPEEEKAKNEADEKASRDYWEQIMPACPAATDDPWRVAWLSSHPIAQGCIEPDGTQIEWGEGAHVHAPEQGDIKSAECFE